MHRLNRFAACCVLMLALTACTAIVPAPTVTPTPAWTATVSPTPRPPLGDVNNPIQMALPPSQFLDTGVVANGQALAALLEKQTGYRIVAVAPTSYAELIGALKSGNAHIAVLPMFAIVKGYQQEAVQALYASSKEERLSYGAQFIARSDRFQSYFDPSSGSNTAEAVEALPQFSGKKPCWAAPDSPSGYFVPAGMLDWYKVPTQEGAFLQSQYAVVRAVRLGEICDFGATYIDARTYPALKDEYPFIMNEVAIIWQIPPIIPYDGIFLSSAVSPEIKQNLSQAFDRIFATNEGKQLMQAVYKIQGISPVQDIFYTEFTRMIQASGTDWENLVH